MKNLILFGVLLAIGLSNACLDTVDPALISYTLYNSANPSGVATISSDNLYPGTKIFLILHGWMEDTTHIWVTTTRDRLRAKYPNLNVITVDWGHYSKDAIYYCAWSAVPAVAIAIANKLQAGAIPTELIYVIGFSIGAQLGGALARQLASRGLPRMDTIFGLDAAGPGFDPEKSLPIFFQRDYLKAGDAVTVVGIYSNRLGLGMNLQYGDYNIMINDGENQNCPVPLLCPIFNPFTEVRPCIFCKHICARTIFVNAIPGSPPYTARKCPSFSQYATCGANPKLDIQPVVPATAEKGLYFISADCTATIS